MIMFLLRFASDVWMFINHLVTALTGFVQAHWILFLIAAVITLWLSSINPAYPANLTEGK